MSVSTSWFERTHLGDECVSDTHCGSCHRNGDCESCGTIDGRFMEEVNTYASTCDLCADLTLHEEMAMDPNTQLGYCKKCIPKLSLEIRERIE